jgi:hypothetical protein
MLVHDAGSKLQKGKSEVGVDRKRQAFLRGRPKEVVVAAVVQHDVDTCQYDRVTGVLKVERSVAL